MAKKIVKKTTKTKKPKAKKINKIQDETYVGPKGLEDTSSLLNTLAEKAVAAPLDEDLGQVQSNSQAQTLKTELPRNISIPALLFGSAVVLILILLAELV